MPNDNVMASSKEKTGRISPGVGQFLTLGLQLAIAVVAFFFIGRWLDEKFATAPILTLVGAGIGIAGGLVKFFRTAMTIGKQADQEFERSHKNNASEDR